MDLLMLLCADDVGAWSVDVEVAGGVGPKDGAVSDEGWLTKDDATNPGPKVTCRETSTNQYHFSL